MMPEKVSEKSLVLIRGPTETRTRIFGFKVQCVHHYTMGPSTSSGILRKVPEKGKGKVGFNFQLLFFDNF